MADSKGLLPFNIFDIFAYLGNGFVVTSVLYMLYEAHRPKAFASTLDESPLLREKWFAVPLAVFTSYAVGHVIAHLSHPVYERILVGRVLGPASEHAVGMHGPTAGALHRARRLILPALGVSDYERELPAEVLTALRTTASGAAAPAPHLHYSVRSCYTTVNEVLPRTSQRIATFLDIYSFSRNASLAFFILSMATFAVGGRGEFWLGVALLIESWIMLGRYLRFLKLYTDEIYLGFAAYQEGLRPAGDATQPTVQVQPSQP